MVLKTDGTATFSPAPELFYYSSSYWELTSDPSVTVVETQVKAVAAGDGHRLYLKNDGRVYAQGRNSKGQLGDASTRAKATPVLVLDDVVAIAAKADHSFFLKTDGSAWAAGDNSFGQLGDGGTNPRSTPVLVLHDVAAIATARTHTLFLKTDGTVWATGYTDLNLADPQAPTSRLVPVQVFADAKAVSAGDSGGSPTTEPGFGVILGDDGSVWRFGRFALSGSAEPVQILTGVAGIHAGEGFCHYITPDGHVLVEGSDKSGSGLGRGIVFYREGNPAPVPAPIQITGHPRNFTVQVGPVIAASPHPYVTLTVPNDTDAIDPPAPRVEVVDGPGFLAPLTASGNPRSRTLYLTAPGSVTLRSSCPGTFYYAAVPPREQTITTASLPQRIHLVTPLPKRVTDAPFPVSVTSTSGLPVNITVVEGPATYDPQTSLLTLTGVGSVRLRASAPGNETFAPAPDVEASFEVSLKPQYLNLYHLPRTKTFGEPPFPLPINTSSPIPIQLTVVSGPAVLIEGGQLKLTGAGTVVIRATQAGNHIYAAAEPTEHTIEVYYPPHITLGGLRQTYTGSPRSATATVHVPHALEGKIYFTYAGSGYPLSPQAPTAPGTYKVAASFGPGGGTIASGKLVIEKAPLTVRVVDATRLVGQANPPFVLAYDGFVGPDADNVPAAVAMIDIPPVAFTKARPNSPAGTYDVTLSGGLDDAYRFVFPKPAGKLTVEGFAGAYETLLLSDGAPLGHLLITVPANALTYTGVLNLAAEPALLSIRGTLSADDGSLATGSWSRAATVTLSGLDLSFDLSGDTIVAEVSRNGSALASGTGARRFTQANENKKKLPAPWTGAHTLVLRDPAPIDEDDTRALPLGAGHASAPVAPTGVMSLRGRLADGSLLTASAIADNNGRFRVFARPYAKRTDSALAGQLALVAHPYKARFPGRHLVPAETGRLFWFKAPATSDKSYRTGFAATVSAALDPWLPPAPRASVMNGVMIPAGTLSQRLGLTSSATATTQLDLAYLLPESSDLLPDLLDLSPAGVFTVASPTTPASLNPTAFTLKVTSATGAFTGGFTLRDQPEGATRPITRKVTFSGTLRQGPEGRDATLGHGHFLLTPLPGSDSTEQISGELILARPGEG